MKSVTKRYFVIGVSLLLLSLSSCTELDEDEFGQAYRDAVWQSVIDHDIRVFDVSVRLQKELRDKNLPERITSLDWQRLIDEAIEITREKTELVSTLTPQQTIDLRTQLKEFLSDTNVVMELGDPLVHIKVFHQNRVSAENAESLLFDAYDSFADDMLDRVETSFGKLTSRIARAQASVKELKAELEN